MAMTNARDVVDQYFVAQKEKDFATMRTLLHDDVIFRGALGSKGRDLPVSRTGGGRTGATSRAAATRSARSRATRCPSSANNSAWFIPPTSEPPPADE